MAGVAKGRAVVWSVGGVTFTAGIVSATNPHFTQSVDYDRDAKVSEVVDNQGIIQSRFIHSFTKSSRLSVVPCAPSGTNSIAEARLSAEAILVKPGTLVTVVDDSGTFLDGNWCVMKGSHRRTLEGAATIDLELGNSDDGVDLATTVT